MYDSDKKISAIFTCTSSPFLNFKAQSPFVDYNYWPTFRVFFKKNMFNIIVIMTSYLLIVEICVLGWLGAWVLIDSRANC